MKISTTCTWEAKCNRSPFYLSLWIWYKMLRGSQSKCLQILTVLIQHRKTCLYMNFVNFPCSKDLKPQLNNTLIEYGQHLNRVWATTFYEANIPFNIVRHPTFVHDVRKIACLQMPTYALSSNNAIYTKLLIAKKANLDKKWRRNRRIL